jgi:antibiotic biosynthesis monooxygenase (ABM) superfamily enzyme
MTVNPDDIVTFIIQHKVRATHREQYEQWLRDIGREAERYPGHLGTNVIRPLDAAGQYTIISRVLVAGIIVWLMVYVIMPRYTRAVADWLYR